MKKRIIALFTVFTLLFCLWPASAFAADGTISSDGTYQLSDYGNDSTVTINAGLTVTLRGSSTTYTHLKIVCSDANTHLTLDNVVINDSSNSDTCALSFSGAGNTLALAGENSLKSGIHVAGILVGNGTELTISGGGSLSVQGGEACAGIGGGISDSSGTVNITGCTVTAVGGYNAAGIGSGMDGTGGVISIEHATVTATGGRLAAGIGGGNCSMIGHTFGTITITSADVTATGGESGAGIGGGIMNSSGSVTITSDTDHNPCIVFASGDTSNSAQDIGNGATGHGASVMLADTAQVFLKNNSITSSLTTHGQTNYTNLSATDGKCYGVTVPDGWSSGFAGYLKFGTLSFGVNGGTGSIASTEYLAGLSATLPDGSGFSNSPKILSGWNTAANGSGDAYALGSNIAPTGNFTLYAIWQIIHVTGVTLNSTEKTLNIGDTAKLTATVKPNIVSYPDVTWASSNNNIATVDQAGLVTAKGAGSAVISATADGKSASCTVTVVKPVTGVTLDKFNISLMFGASDTLAVTVSPSDATNKTVTWSSDNTAVATVNQSGAVTAKALGRAVITAKSGNCSATCEVFVSSIMLNIRLAVNDKTSLSAAVASGSASAAWKSSNSAVATVDQSGFVTAVKEGSAVITVTTGGVSQSVGILVGPPASISAPAAKAAASSYNSASVSWGAVNTASYYEVWRSTVANGGYVLVKTTGAVSYADSGLATGTAYYYKVRAVYSGTSKVQGAYSTVVCAKPVLAAPASCKASRASATSIKASWAAVSGATKYELWRATSANGKYTLVKTTASLNFTNTGCKKKTKYYYKVRAYRTVNGKNVPGAYSGTASSKT